MPWELLAPFLIVAVGALATLGAEPFIATAADKHRQLPWAASIFLILAMAAVVPQLQMEGVVSLHGLYAFDALRGWLDLAIIGAAFFGIVGLQQSLGRDSYAGGEPYALTLLASLGAMLMVHANDTIGLYIGVELASLSVYSLVGTRRHRADSNEGLFKYYIMGAVFSAVLLYGAALTYGATGGTQFGMPVMEGRETLFALGQVLITIGLLFKVGAFPFHFWAPDAYVAAPLPVTGFMAAIMKLGGFAGLGLLWLNALSLGAGVAGGGTIGLHTVIHDMVAMPEWMIRSCTLLLALAVLSLLWGNFSALGQTSARRIMAYSSIAHAGYVLIAFAAPPASQPHLGLQAAWYYLVAYGVATAAGLCALSFMAGHEDDDDLGTLSGGARRYPFAGVVATLALVSLAGVPLTAGFLGKYMILYQLVVDGRVFWALVAMVMAVVGAAFYFRMIAALWAGGSDVLPARRMGILGGLALTAALIAMIGLLFVQGAFVDDSGATLAAAEVVADSAAMP